MNNKKCRECGAECGHRAACSAYIEGGRPAPEPESWVVDGAPSPFASYQDAEDWRTAQIWDGGIGMMPLPQKV